MHFEFIISFKLIWIESTPLKEFISTLKTVEKVEILPYHDLGKFKWEKLGCKYELEGYRTANQEDVKRAKEILGI